MQNSLSHSLLKSAFDNELSATLFGLPSGQILKANNAACNMFGYTQEEFYDIGRQGIVVQNTNETRMREDFLQSGKAEGVLQMRRKNGNIFDANVEIHTLTTTDNNNYICLTFFDVSEKENLRAALTLKNKEFANLLKFCSDIIGVVDAKGNRRFISDSTLAIFGYRPDELINKPIFDLTYEDDKDATRQIWLQINILKSIKKFENRVVHKNGHLVNMSWSFNLDDETQDIFAVGRDVTAQKQADAALIESETRFRTYIEQATEAIFVHDFSGRFVDVNKQASLTLGYTREELLKMSVLDIEDDFDLISAQAEWKKVLPGQSPLTLKGHHKRKDGTTFPVEVQFSYIEKNGLANYLGAVRDITENVEIQQKLSESEKKYRSLIKHLTIGVIKHAPDTTILISNPAAIEMLGLTEDQLLGKTSFDPDWNVIHEDGTDFPGNLHPVSVAIATKQPVRDVIMGVYRPMIKDRVWLLVDADPTLQEDGELDHVIVTFKNITKQVITQNELKISNLNQLALNTALEHKTLELKDKNVELEQFASIAAHDLQHPLTTFNGVLQLFKIDQATNLSDSGNEYIQYMEQGVTKMQTLIRDLLHYAKAGAGALDIKPVDLNLIAKEVLESFNNPENPADADIFIAPLPVIKANKNGMLQLMQNLVGNALKYKGESRPLIKITAEENEQQWVISVKDNGIGIDPRYADKVFKIFERLQTKQKFNGTGIGLASCKKIVERHNGRIWVESSLGEGADFKFSIPKRQPSN